MLNTPILLLAHLSPESYILPQKISSSHQSLTQRFQLHQLQIKKFLIHTEKLSTLCKNWKPRSALFLTLYFIHLKGIFFRIVTNLYFVWPYNCTMMRRAIKVTYSFHHAIMISQWFIILNSNPETRCQ